MSKIVSNIFLLNNINNLGSLNRIFSRRHNELLSHSLNDADQVSRMSENEKYFVYSWKEIKEAEEISLPKVSIDNENPEETLEVTFYQKAIANLEYTKRKKKDGVGNFLPKADRLNEIDIDTIFFEKDNKVYVLINSSNEVYINRLKKLIGLSNISSENEAYSLDVDLFNWLIYVYTEQSGNLTEDTVLENISGFEGNVTDDANVFTGASQQTTELVVTKAFISNGGVLRKITVRVRDTDIDIICMINESSNVVIYCTNSSKLRVMEPLDKPTFLQLYLYGYLILKLKQLYSIEAENFVEEVSPRFSKKIGIEVIKSIVEKNDITLGDIEFLLLDEAAEQNLI